MDGGQSRLGVVRGWPSGFCFLISFSLRDKARRRHPSMCSVIILRRPGHPWPVLLAANRDEMIDRPWRPPARHWPKQPDVLAGLDTLGGGTWLGLNDAGVVAGVLNRINTLGPVAGMKSRGALVLSALTASNASEAAQALPRLVAGDYRPFNMIVIDRERGYWIRAAAGAEGGAVATVEIYALPDEGLSMITAYDLNDKASPRIRRFLPRFAEARPPAPERGDWYSWVEILADRTADDGVGPGGAMTVVTTTGFGTVSMSLIALPADPRARPHFLFAAGRPGEATPQEVIDGR